MKTTKEEADQKIHKNRLEALQELLKKNYDAEKGFKKAIEKTKHQGLKGFLKNQAISRNHFATELDKTIREMNEHPEEEGTASGTIHRGWINLKTAISGNDDKAVLEECIRGDKSSVKEYQEKLEEIRFSPPMENLLNQQLQSIKATLNRVKSLEDLNEERKS